MNKPLNVIYSRVSKENETLQDLGIQEKMIIEKFGLKNPKILRERKSAYKMEDLKERTEFLRILKYAFSYEKLTLKDVWLGNYEKKPVNLYVWDSHRLMRNIEYSLFFQLLSDLFDVTIYTHKDGKLKENDDETPSKKLLRYMVMAIHAYSGEEYSYTISENIKKSIKQEGDIKYGVKKDPKGRKWGLPFRNAQGEKVQLSIEAIIKFKDKVKKLKAKKTPYRKIIRIMAKENNLKLSMGFISNC